MMMRLTAYAGSSLALAAGVLLKALNQRVNFYSACVYLSQSNACVIVLVNLLILTIGTIVFLLQRLLYGPLRPVEAEQLYDRAWFAVTETCLAMTMFREEIGVWFVLLFISLLVGKAWAWIGEGRVEILDQQPPANPRLFHARLSISLLLSLLFDVYFLNYSVGTVRHQARPTMMVMFAFEFAVLTAGSVSTTFRYMISLREAAILRQQTEQRITELRHEREIARQQAGDATVPAPADEEIDETDIDVPGWEDKGRWVFYLELLTDLVRLVLYLTFFCVLCVFYGLPIYIIRDVAMAIRSFYKRITDFVKYRHATRDMNERYPDATAEDVGDRDVCIICRETMRPWQEGDQETRDRPSDQRLRPKKLPCGHILHFACLRSWLERQQICPTCRQPVISDQVARRQPDIQPRQPQRENPNPPVAAAGPVNEDQIPRVVPQPQHRPGAGPARAHAGNGWRRFDFGPLRVDVGAWHGQPPPAPADPPNHAPLPQPPAQNQRIPTSGMMNDQYRGQRLPYQAPAPDASAAQMQIDLIEQQMQQQLNSLRVSMNHLSRIRASQEELIRLHGLQHGGGLPSVQVFRSDLSGRPLQAGSEQLPAGLTLPDGWSLLPLSRNSQVPPSTSHALAATGAIDGRTPQASGVSVPDLPTQVTESGSGEAATSASSAGSGGPATTVAANSSSASETTSTTSGNGSNTAGPSQDT